MTTSARCAPECLVVLATVCALAAPSLTLAQSQERRVRLGRRLPEWAKASWFIRRQAEAPWALTGGNVIDVRTGEIHRGVNIVMTGDLIQSVGRDDLPPNIKTVDVSGQYVVPGFFDLHAHVIHKSRFRPEALDPEETLRALLDSGVTTIRALPLSSESALLWSARINNGELTGPTIIPASGILEKEAERTSRGFGDALTARRWVQKEALLGSRWIKVYNRMDAESLRTIVQTAREYGMRVCGHAWDVPPHQASAIGMATIEHANSIPISCLPDDVELPTGLDLGARTAWLWEHADDAKIRTLLETFKENGTGWVPTLVVLEQMAERGGHDGRSFADEGVRQRLRDALRKAAMWAVRFHRMDGRIGLGTDFPIDGVPPGESVHREMQLLVELGGASPLEALQIATIESARVLGHGELLGTIEANRIANLVVLRANPLDDIANAGEIARVVHDGRLVQPVEE